MFEVYTNFSNPIHMIRLSGKASVQRSFLATTYNTNSLLLRIHNAKLMLSQDNHKFSINNVF